MNRQIHNYVAIILYPSKKWVLVLDFLSCMLLLYIFDRQLNETMLANFIYVLSFYSFIITVVQVYKITAVIRAKIHGITCISKYYADIQFRMKVKLYASVSINIAYAVFKLVIGCFYQSIWEIHLGIYYFILCMVRCILLRHVNYRELGEDKQQEYQKYRLCAFFLLALNVILSGVVILMVWRNYTYRYPGYIIYLAAMYTFYLLISAIYNMVKFHRYQSPLINAIQLICFVTALVSVLSLQTAMLTQFGTEGITMKQMANGCTGLVVCIIIFIIAIAMMFHAKKAVRQLAHSSSL